MHPFPRRRFVKGLFLGTAFSAILGKSWTSAYAAVSTPSSQVATFQININDYPALLQEELGSVRLGVSPVGPDYFPASRYYPIIINRDQNGFYVLNSICKHAAACVNAFDTDFFAMRCPFHGSLYDIRGDVIEGPATEPLTAHDFTFDGATSILTVVVPEMGFQVKSFLPDPQPGTRLQLEFTAEGGVTYEVRFREKLTDPWQRALFSRTPGGPANEELLLGNGDPNTLYLDRTTPTGFYAASMFLEEV